MHRPHALTYALACALAAPAARADDGPAASRRTASETGITVRADRVRRDRARVEDSARFATSIDVRARGAVVESVADLLDEAPGVQARRSGDGLAPTTLVLRGAGNGRLTFALDGVVLNDAAGEGVDLSLIPPGLLERVDVYRGFAPSRLGVSGLGGDVEFITRAPGARPWAWASAGYGSFGQRRAGVAVSGRAGPVSMLLSLGYRGTQGDFSFYDNHGTPADTSDDLTSTRVNNAGDALDLLYRACAGAPGRVGCVLLVHDWRRRGVPGPFYPQYASPGLDSRRLLVRGSFRAALGGGFLEPYVAVQTRGDHYFDYAGQVIAGRVVDTASGTTGGEAGVVGTLRTGPLRVEPVLRARAERYVASGSTQGDIVAFRASVLEGLDLIARAGPAEFTLAAAGEALSDEADAGGECAGAGCRGLPGTRRLMLSPRLSARVALREGLELRANVGHMERAPSLVELYGLGDYLHGDVTLRPEVSDGADAGFVAHARTGGWEARLEGAAYARFVRDLISFVPVGFWLRAADIGDARVLGAEALARVSYRGVFSGLVSYGFADAVFRPRGAQSYAGRVPGVPQHDLYARVEGALGPAHAWVDFSLVSGVFYGQSNVLVSPTQYVLGAGLSVRVPWVPGVSLTVLGTNLLDQRTGTVCSGATAHPEAIADYAGYPLPGRAVFAQLSYTVGGAN